MARVLAPFIELVNRIVNVKEEQKNKIKRFHSTTKNSLNISEYSMKIILMTLFSVYFAIFYFLS